MEAAGQLEVLGVFPLSSPEEHQMTVSAAIGTMQNTRLRKVVLARAVDVAFADEIDPLLIAARMIDLSALRDGYAVDLSATGRADDRGTMLVGSSPEVLVRRTGNAVEAHPLAGSAARCPTRRRTRPSDAPPGLHQGPHRTPAGCRPLPHGVDRGVQRTGHPRLPELIRTTRCGIWPHRSVVLRTRAFGPDLALMLAPDPGGRRGPRRMTRSASSTRWRVPAVSTPVSSAGAMPRVTGSTW